MNFFYKKIGIIAFFLATINLNFGLSSLDSEEFTTQISGFSAEVNGQRPFAKQKSMGDASKIPESEGEKPEVQVIDPNIVFSMEKISSEEGALLFSVFQSLLKDTEAGYVLYGQKPVYMEGFYENTCVFEPSEFHQVLVALCAAKQALVGPLFNHGNIIIYIGETEKEILIINRELFIKTVNDNLPLFQYVLGPTITPEILLNSILSKERDFCSALNNDNVLIGIVLGFGVQNSLHVSRREEIHETPFSYDTPPLEAKVNLCVDERKKEILFFFPTKRAIKRVETKNKKITIPSIGFSSLKDEERILSAKIRSPSKKLIDTTPLFVFGCIGEEKSDLEKSLEITQEKIQRLLKSSSFLADVLEMIAGDKVEVASENTFSFSLPSIDINLAAAKLLKCNMQDYEDEYLTFFSEGLLQKREDVAAPDEPLLGFAEAIDNVKLAKKNLIQTDAFFKRLRNNDKCNCVCEDYLYFQTLEHSQKRALDNEVRVCINYEIFDPGGKCLSNDLKTLDLRDTIPGFAHGIKGMQIDEKRVIYIHPALAYGVHTYLDKGIYLKAIVKLKAIDNLNGELPSIEPLDLSFIKSDEFQQKCEEDHKKNVRFIGMIRGKFLRSCEGIDIKKVANYFCKLKGNCFLSKDEALALNQLFWNHYFANE